jgi:hypothetical protein
MTIMDNLKGSAAVISTPPQPAPISEPKPEPQKVPELQLHPFCEIVPPCTETEAAELKADIKANGLRLPIKMFDTKILDGRSRYNACRELEAEGHPIELRREYFSGTPAEALVYVMSMNVKRRHLSASKRAVIVAKLVNSTVGGNHSVKLPNEITQDLAAKLAGVSTKMVTDAKAVLDSNDTDLVKKVLNGETAVAVAAKKVREAKKAEEAKKNEGGDTAATTTPPAFDVDKALKVYDEAEEKLVHALVALQNASNLGHVKEKLGKTIEKLNAELALKAVA